MKKRLWAAVLIFILLIPLLNVTASADSGPKPSVVVSFKGLKQESYYVTLLSEKASTGPYSKSNEYRPSYGSEEIWRKFSQYPDADGFYFLGFFSDCSDTDTFKWTYYPPATFKILLYFPEYDRFIVSPDIYERYAFDSYYTVDASGLDIQSVTAAGEDMSVRRTYDFTWEVFSLLCRIAATIAIELGAAWLFGFHRKKHIRIIALTNIATQTILNILLNIVNYNGGQFAFIFNYVWMELAIIIIEGIIYTKLLRQDEAAPGRKRSAWEYAFAANILSFAVGMLIAKWMPGIF